MCATSTLRGELWPYGTSGHRIFVEGGTLGDAGAMSLAGRAFFERTVPGASIVLVKLHGGVRSLHGFTELIRLAAHGGAGAAGGVGVRRCTAACA